MGVRTHAVKLTQMGKISSSIDREVDETCCYPTRSALNRVLTGLRTAVSECTPRPEEASRSSRKTPWWNLRRDASGLGKPANPRRNRAKPTRLHFAGGASGPGAGSCRATVPRRRAGPPTAVASGALPRPPDPDRAHGAERRSPARLVHVERVPAERRAQAVAFFVPAALVVLLLTIAVPAARLALVVVVAVEAVAVGVVPLVEQLAAATTTRPAPRSTRDPTVHVISRRGLLPSTVESLRADLHDQHGLYANRRRRRDRTGQAYPP